MTNSISRPILAAATLALSACVKPQPGGTQDDAAATIFAVTPDKPDALIAARDAVRAWRAQGHANEAAVIRLGRGAYTLTQPLVLGVQDGNTTWIAPEREKTTISGGVAIKAKWEDCGDGVFACQASGPGGAALHFEQLYVNGRPAVRARMPDAEYFKIGALQHEKQPNGREKIMVRLPDDVVAALPTDARALRDVNLLLLHKWDTTRAFIAALDRSTGVATFEDVRWKPWNSWNDKCRYSIENFRGALNAPGEWFLDRDGRLFLRPRAGERIERAEFVAPVVPKLVVIDGASNLRFAGLRFRHSGYRVPEDGNDPMQAAAFVEGAIQVDGASGVQFEDCEVSCVATYGIWFRAGCKDGLIRRCLFEDLGAGGIRIGETSRNFDHLLTTGLTERIIVDNNIVRRTGFFHPSACGLIVGQSPNNRITHNDISRTTYTGISVGWTWGYGLHHGTNNFIGFNRVHAIGQGLLSDLGGIYTLGNGAGSVCIGNLFYDVRAHDYGGWGIYHDEGSAGWRDESNVCWNCTCVNPGGGNGFHQHYGKENRLVNNILAFSSGPQVHATRVEPHTSVILERNLVINDAAPLIGGLARTRFESRNNCYVFTGTNTTPFAGKDFAGWQAAGHDTGSVFLTALEVEGRWPDIALPKDSPAIAAGFQPINTYEAGIYGEYAWRRRATE